MRVLLITALLAFLVAFVTARSGSISKDIVDDDPNDEGEEPDLSVSEERKRNPCIRKKCYRGETCVLDSNQSASCICTPDCSFYARTDRRTKVCSNKNDTYDTECHLNRDHCLCKRKQDGCTRMGARKIQLEYYGECQELKDCTESEASQFPARMTQWLFVVMETMATREKISEYEDLLEEAKNDANHTQAVVWKFCDLDKDPQDRIVTKRELVYTVRSLKAMERCLMPFLDDCDANDDKQITLVEWGGCLGMEHDKISDKCHKIHGNKKKSRK